MTNKQESIQSQIKKKEAEIDKLTKKMRQEQSLTDIAMTQVVINRLYNDIEELNKQLIEGSTPPSKEELLQMIDDSLDNRNKEEFMRLTNLLKSME